jgi:hypothetical protein
VNIVTISLNVFFGGLILIMKSVLESYLKKCREIFNDFILETDQKKSLIALNNLTKYEKMLFKEAIIKAEDTEEFENLYISLLAGPLEADMQRLVKKEERRRKKLPKKYLLKSQTIDMWKQKTGRQAAGCFLRNTGTYLKLWESSAIDVNNLVGILESYDGKNESDDIRLFVFDGFIPWNNRRELKKIILPEGELKKYAEDELKRILLYPQSVSHDLITTETIKEASHWPILTVKNKAKYRGFSGLWINRTLVSLLDWSDIGEPIKKTENIDLIGPVFLCIGEDANLASEILIRGNIFELLPVYSKTRNGHLPWDITGEDGEPHPRTNIKHLGEDGINLISIFKIWGEINGLDKSGFLTYPTESYVRTILNMHRAWGNYLDIFVGFITVIESLLSAGSRTELNYKSAMRGAALLSPCPENRILYFNKLRELYKIRSKIVHEGYVDKKTNLETLIKNNLNEIAQMIFLRYIFALYMCMRNKLPSWIKSNPSNLKSRKNRSNEISNILDSFVMDSKPTEFLEKYMNEFGIKQN